MDVVRFQEDVYAVVFAIPYGKVLTYGEVAWLAGYPHHSRMVGRILHDAGISLPCHRVVNAQGRLAPYCEEQRGLLLAEGVVFKPNGCVDMAVCRWEY